MLYVWDDGSGKFIGRMYVCDIVTEPSGYAAQRGCYDSAR